MYPRSCAQAEMTQSRSHATEKMVVKNSVVSGSDESKRAQRGCRLVPEHHRWLEQMMTTKGVADVDSLQAGHFGGRRCDKLRQRLESVIFFSLYRGLNNCHQENDGDRRVLRSSQERSKRRGISTGNRGPQAWSMHRDVVPLPAH